ncbi:MAG: hypothetical protein HZA46_24740 [Planctomycetales bacterium]|nr:hypothetical protein [Planctomycetales bacterium]
MPVLAVQSILAKIDIGDIFAILMALVGFISWIVTQVNNNNKMKNPAPKPAGQPQRPPARRDEKIFEEINVFLEQKEQRPAGQQPRKVKPPARSQPAAGRKAPMGKVKSGSVSAKPLAAPLNEPRQTHRTPGGDIARRKLTGSEELGSQVRERVSDMQKSRVESKVQQDLRSHISESVKADLGEFSAAAGSTSSDPGTATASSIKPQTIGDFLRQPGNMRQAIVLNLILTPPPGLRRKR